MKKLNRIIITVVGTRPELTKIPLLLESFAKIAHSKLIHTGQHYDYKMDKIFFDELAIPKPDYYLGIGSASQAKQTGRLLEKIEEILLKEKPALVVVYGDTNSTLAGALVAAKLNIPVAHIEAGMRSYNRQMPEEINRIITDHISSLLFCPTLESVKNLKKEGINKNVYWTGDLTADIIKKFKPKSEDSAKLKIIKKYGLKSKSYLLATVHRVENTDRRENLENILKAFNEIGRPMVFPVHPRTKKFLLQYRLDKIISKNPKIRLTEPLGFFEMIALEANASLILTDSGGVQKEAYLLRIPCVTLRDETEWTEAVKSGWNKLAGADPKKIVALAKNFPKPKKHPNFLGDGRGYRSIAKIIQKHLKMLL